MNILKIYMKKDFDMNISTKLKLIGLTKSKNIFC